MKCIDWRSWTERRIAMLALLVSILSFGYTIYDSNENSKALKQSACLEKANAKMEQLVESLHESPKLLSGCYVRPDEYCREARSKIAKIKNICVVLINTISEDINYSSVLKNIISRIDLTEEHLKASGKEIGPNLVEDAQHINELRTSLGALNIKNIKCTK